MTTPNLEAAINRGLNEAIRLGFIASGSHAHFIAGFLRAHISPLVPVAGEDALECAENIRMRTTWIEPVEQDRAEIARMIQALVDSSVALAVADKDKEIERLKAEVDHWKPTDNRYSNETFLEAYRKTLRGKDCTIGNVPFSRCCHVGDRLQELEARAAKKGEGS